MSGCADCNDGMFADEEIINIVSNISLFVQVNPGTDSAHIDREMERLYDCVECWKESHYGKSD